MRYYYFVTLSLLLSLSQAQTQLRPFDDANRPFFEAQLPYFQAWLEDRGFTQVLAIDHLELRPDMMTVYLFLTAYKRDSARMVWEGFVEQYQQIYESEPAEDLHTYLCFLMEQPRKNVTIELYDVDRNDDRSLCYFLFMFYEKGRFQTESESGCMSEKRQVRVPFFHLSPDSIKQSLALNSPALRKKRAEEILEEVYKHGDAYFTQRGVRPVLNREGIDKLSLEVKGLTSEVLADLPKELIEGLFGLAKKERLLLIFEIKEEKEAFVIKVEIHGMYGSGIFSISDSGYRPMEPTYKSYLFRYANRYSEDLHKYLNN